MSDAQKDARHSQATRIKHGSSNEMMRNAEACYAEEKRKLEDDNEVLRSQNRGLLDRLEGLDAAVARITRQTEISGETAQSRTGQLLKDEDSRDARGDGRRHDRRGTKPLEVSTVRDMNEDLEAAQGQRREDLRSPTSVPTNQTSTLTSSNPPPMRKAEQRKTSKLEKDNQELQRNNRRLEQTVEQLRAQREATIVKHGQEIKAHELKCADLLRQLKRYKERSGSTNTLEPTGSQQRSTAESTSQDINNQIEEIALACVAQVEFGAGDDYPLDDAESVVSGIVGHTLVGLLQSRSHTVDTSIVSLAIRAAIAHCVFTYLKRDAYGARRMSKDSPSPISRSFSGEVMRELDARPLLSEYHDCDSAGLADLSVIDGHQPSSSARRSAEAVEKEVDRNTGTLSPTERSTKTVNIVAKILHLAGAPDSIPDLLQKLWDVHTGNVEKLWASVAHLGEMTREQERSSEILFFQPSSAFDDRLMHSQTSPNRRGLIGRFQAHRSRALCTIGLGLQRGPTATVGNSKAPAQDTAVVLKAIVVTESDVEPTRRMTMA